MEIDKQTFRQTMLNQDRKLKTLTVRSLSQKKAKFMNSETQIDRQTDRQTDSQTDRKTDRQIHRQTVR